jgi:hypothetical protein
MDGMYVYTYACMYVCMYVYMHVCTYVHMYVCMYVCMYVRTFKNFSDNRNMQEAVAAKDLVQSAETANKSTFKFN